MKNTKYIYWGSTGLMCIIFTFSALMYFFDFELAADYFDRLGYPTWLVYPSAIAKVLGVTAVLTNRSYLLKEWAYAGFFFDALLAFTSHTIVGDGEGGIALVALIAIIVSRYTQARLQSVS